MSFHIVIPARFDSKRLRHKLLLDLGGLSILERTYQKACEANPLSITIATDSEKIKEIATNFGATVMLTSGEHESGTSRCSEVVERLGLKPNDVVVNLQGDEPFMPPEFIIKVAATLNALSEDIAVATVISHIKTLEAFLNPAIVKVILNAHSEAVFFSRSSIPYCRDNPEDYSGAWRHFGIYAYRAHFLRQYTNLAASPYESLESLEQLRILWHGFKIATVVVKDRVGLEINTQAELDEARLLLS